MTMDRCSIYCSSNSVQIQVQIQKLMHCLQEQERSKIFDPLSFMRFLHPLRCSTSDDDSHMLPHALGDRYLPGPGPSSRRRDP